MREGNGRAAAACATLLLMAVVVGRAEEFKVGASVRNYDFLRLGDEGRHDAEYLSFRVMPEVSFFDKAVKFESHVVVDVTSPVSSAGLANGRIATWLPMQYDTHTSGRVQASGYVDRLNVSIHTSKADVTVGRQAITWGVNTIFPALDLFAPFAPMRIDRDYKTGVDAVRVTVPVGAHTEVQTVGAVLGESGERDASGGALVRFSAGTADFGAMSGSFHGDKVAGGFFSAGVRGTVVRGEFSWTQADRAPAFARAGLGFDRQISKKVNVVVEGAMDGFGASSPSGYAAILASERLRRGEVAGLGRWHAGAMGSWQFHPLGKLNQLLLYNCNDSSAVWVPWLEWSTGNSSVLLAGGQFVAGGKTRSEYGSISNRLFVGFKIYL